MSNDYCWVRSKIQLVQHPVPDRGPPAVSGKEREEAMLSHCLTVIQRPATSEPFSLLLAFKKHLAYYSEL